MTHPFPPLPSGGGASRGIVARGDGGTKQPACGEARGLFLYLRELRLEHFEFGLNRLGIHGQA